MAGESQDNDRQVQRRWFRVPLRLRLQRPRSGFLTPTTLRQGGLPCPNVHDSGVYTTQSNTFMLSISKPFSIHALWYPVLKI